MLAQIDHNGPNLTLLTLKITFRVLRTFHILGKDWFYTEEATW